jgi:hypothetical protein
MTSNAMASIPRYPEHDSPVRSQSMPPMENPSPSPTLLSLITPRKPSVVDPLNVSSEGLQSPEGQAFISMLQVA